MEDLLPTAKRDSDFVLLTDSHYTLDDVAYCAGTQVWSEDDPGKPKRKKFKRACRDEKGRILVRIDKEV